MTEWLSRGDPSSIIPLLIPIVAIFMGCLTGMVAIITGNWQRVRKAELAAALKQEMIQRGMSSEDIKRVLETPLVTMRKESHCPTNVNDV